MIGPMEIFLILIFVLFMFRTDEIGDLLRKVREIRTQYREMKIQITRDIIHPIKDTIEGNNQNSTKTDEDHSRNR